MSAFDASSGHYLPTEEDAKRSELVTGDRRATSRKGVAPRFMGFARGQPVKVNCSYKSVKLRCPPPAWARQSSRRRGPMRGLSMGGLDVIGEAEAE